MDYSSGLKMVFIVVFGSIYGHLTFFVGLVVSVAFSLWTQSLGRRLYFLFVVVCSVPVVAIAAGPLITNAMGDSGRSYHPDRSLLLVIWMFYFAFASPFAVGVVLGALLSPLSRWLKTS